MNIFIKVKPGSSEDKVEEIEGCYLVFVKEQAVEGKVNSAVRRVLAQKFRVSEKDILIKTGKGRKKVVEIVGFHSFL